MNTDAVRLDFRDGGSRARVLRDEAALSSAGFGWSALYFEHRRRQALDTVEHVMQEHYLMVKLNPLSMARRVLDGRPRREVQPRGAAAYVPSGCAHRVQYEGELGSLHLMTLRPALVESVAQELGISRVDVPPHHADAPNAFVLHAAELVHAELRQGNPHGPLFADTFARTLAAHLLTGFARGARPAGEKSALGRGRLRRVHDYIGAHLGEAIGLADLARQAGLSEYHFCRCFKWETGLSPYQYVLRCRIEHACALLAAKDEPPLQEIAFSCGFGDPVQFSRQFKKATGMTPSACRAASRS